MDNNKLHLYKLSFSAPLHIGNERDDNSSGSSMVHSDTLYAAIFFAWDKLGKSEWIPTEQKKETGFALSSLFPFYQDNFFLPRPLYSPEIEYKELESTVIRKQIKKAAWVDTVIFQDSLNDLPINYHGNNNFSDSFWSSNPLPEKAFITSQVMPRVTVPRENGEDTTIFYIERFYFEKDAGLYFLAQFDKIEQQQRLEAALRLLGDEGFGTDRNIGHGKFTFEKKEATLFNFNFTRKKGLAVSLGLYCPLSKEETQTMLSKKAVGYDLVKRGGWLSEPYQSWRKKSVYMFREGSVLGISNPNSVFALGENVDVNPKTVPVPHPVWRCGKTIFLSF